MISKGKIRQEEKRVKDVLFNLRHDEGFDDNRRLLNGYLVTLKKVLIGETVLSKEIVEDARKLANFYGGSFLLGCYYALHFSLTGSKLISL